MTLNVGMEISAEKGNESKKNEPRLQGVNRTTVVTPVKSAIDAIQA